MIYKVLNNNTAVLLTMSPQIIYGNLRISFEDAPGNVTAIFKCGDASYYRELKDGICEIPSDKLSGEVKISLAILDTKTPLQKWICDSLNAQRTKDGGVLVSLKDLIAPETVAKLRIENQNIRNEFAAVRSELQRLDALYHKIMDVYDFT